MTGRVIMGINNIFTVRYNDQDFECRIKGKILKDVVGAYNALAVGDLVEFEEDLNHPGKGMILSRHERRNYFSRWNNKKRAPQTIAANLDQIFCVASPESPPFRPRFVDRVVLSAELGKVPVHIIVNKQDQGISSEMEERLQGWRNLGLQIFYTSAKEETGLDSIRKAVEGKYTAFIGQSGVGKSSLLNALEPGLKLKVGRLSAKYNRGNHTTCYAMEISSINQVGIVDTPGIRELEVYGLEPQDLQHHFNEFEPFLHDCGFTPCSHTHEPKCKVKEAVEQEKILYDRYLSYVHMYEALVQQSKAY